LPDLPESLEVRQKGRLESIISGSLRLNDRLSHCPGLQKEASKECKRCGAPIEDARHLFWTCKDSTISDIRAKYEPIIQELGCECRPMFHFNYAPYLNCGIIPDALGLAEATTDITVQNVELENKVRREGLDLDMYEHWTADGRLATFSDGSCDEPSDYRVARSAFSVIYGCEGHPHNKALPVEGLEHSPYRAELRAVVCVAEETTVPIEHRLDNESVQLTAQKLVDRKHDEHPVALPEYSRDLWLRLWQQIQDRPDGFFRFVWMKGHLRDGPQERLEKYLCLDGYEQWHVDLHTLADQMAGQAVRSLSFDLHKQIGLRKQIAMVTQYMYLQIWNERLKDLHAEEEAAEIERQYDIEAEQAERAVLEASAGHGMGNASAHRREPVHAALRASYPDYSWQVDAPQMDQYKALDLGYISTHNRGKKLAKTFSFPEAWWEPFLMYVRELNWHISLQGGRVAQADQDEASEEKQVPWSFAEMALDFEVYTGYRLETLLDGPRTPWAKKARFVQSMWDTLARHSRGMKALKWTKLKRRVSTLRGFGIPLQAGITKRPLLAGGRDTEKLVVRNAAKYLETSNLPERKKQGDGCLMLPVDYTGLNKPFNLSSKNQFLLACRLESKDGKSRRVSGKTSFKRAAHEVTEEEINVRRAQAVKEAVTKTIGEIAAEGNSSQMAGSALDSAGRLARREQVRQASSARIRAALAKGRLIRPAGPGTSRAGAGPTGSERPLMLHRR